MSSSTKVIDRRRFIHDTVRRTGVIATAATLAALNQKAQAAESQPNPLVYDFRRVARTDPSLVRYTQQEIFACPRPQPRRIVFGPKNRLYVAAANCVCVLDEAGALVQEIAVAGQARCVAVAGDGTVYAGLRDHVEVFRETGARVAKWESPGKKTWLTGLATAGDNVYAADSGNRAVLRYDRAGKLLGRIGKRDKEKNVPGLIVPSPYLDVKVASDGLLRVNNFGRHRVEVYTPEGGLELSWGKASAGIEGFCGCCNPVGFTLLPDGRYVTCEKGLPRVKVYSSEGDFECVVAGTEAFPEKSRAGNIMDREECMLGGLDAAAAPSGKIYVLDLVAANVRVLTRKSQA